LVAEAGLYLEQLDTSWLGSGTLIFMDGAGGANALGGAGAIISGANTSRW